MLIDLVRNGTFDPAKIQTQYEAMGAAIDAYKAVAEHQPAGLRSNSPA